VAGLTQGKPLVSVSPGQAAARLERLPWVAKATVRRQWPTTVAVHIAERTPVGLLPDTDRGSTARVDASGRVLAVGGAHLPTLPAITGIGTAGAPGTWLAASPGPGPGGSQPDAAGARGQLQTPSGEPGAAGAALTLAGELPPALVPAVRTISVGPGPSLRVMVDVTGLGATPPATQASSAVKTSTVAFDFGDSTQLPAKVLAVQTLVDQVNLSGVTTVDVSVPNRPVMAGAGSGH
jgi:hypothetical protein